MNRVDDQEAKERLAEFVRRAQKGELGAFEEIVAHTEAYARKLAYPIVGPELCEDALQESFLLAYRKLGQLKDPTAFISWLCRLVLHVSYRMKKKNPVWEALPEDEKSGEGLEPLLDSMVLCQALDEMREKDKKLLVLRELLQLSYDEISRVLRVPTGTVRSRLHKARNLLSEKLKGLFEGRP